MFAALRVDVLYKPMYTLLSLFFLLSEYDFKNNNDNDNNKCKQLIVGV